MRRIIVVLAIVLVAAGATVMITLLARAEHELKEAQESVFKLALELKEVREGAEALLARKAVLEADVAALTTPAVTEALNMWAQFPEVCLRQSIGNLMQGDYGCAVQALPASTRGQAFPTGKLRAEILKDPVKALASGKSFLKDRCARIAGAKPKVCYDYGPF